MRMQVDLSFGARQLAVKVVTADCKCFSVTVHPDLRITAKAPAGYEPEVIPVMAASCLILNSSRRRSTASIMLLYMNCAICSIRAMIEYFISFSGDFCGDFCQIGKNVRNVWKKL